VKKIVVHLNPKHNSLPIDSNKFCNLGIGTCLPVSNEKGGELSAMLNIKIQQQEELAASLQLKLHKLKVILNSLKLSGISVVH
jgi:hypothetical protein